MERPCNTRRATAVLLTSGDRVAASGIKAKISSRERRKCRNRVAGYGALHMLALHSLDTIQPVSFIQRFMEQRLFLVREQPAWPARATGAAVSAAQPASSLQQTWWFGCRTPAEQSANRRGGRVLHGPDGEVETVGDDQAVRLGRRREGRKHIGRGSRLLSSVRASWRFL